mmetsp:Transcript_12892/g.24137  ORF Transcript_12892/g.24137 Transcript_12892/m.24137 type:complete len:128 (-) Transcript_12892:1764-2147(-)
MASEDSSVTSSQNTTTTTASSIQNKESQREEVHSLREENRLLQDRLTGLQNGLFEMRKENSVLKMKVTLTLGSMRLEIDSLEEDRKFLIEKYHDLRRKIEESKEDLRVKEQELHGLKVTRRPRSKSL